MFQIIVGSEIGAIEVFGQNKKNWCVDTWARDVWSSPDGRNLKDVPLNGHVKLGEVDADLDLVGADLLVHVSEVDLQGWSKGG